jgi:Xaa-Pro aminopeptidase
MTPTLLLDRLSRLRTTMAAHDVPALLTADPISIGYAVGARNMTIFSMMGASRFLLVLADGPTIMYEFAGCEHLVDQLPTIDDVRVAPGITAQSGTGAREAATTFAREIVAACRDAGDPESRLAVERFELPITDALRTAGATLVPATGVILEARRVKLPDEIAIMRTAIERVETGLREMAASIEPGRTEIEVWSELHRHLIANEGEYVSTRLAQSGPRTFPYFQEAGTRVLEAGDLFCLDTDAIGYGGYAVDLSRTYAVGGGSATTAQRSLHTMALEQLQHNAAQLAPGRSYEEFARAAWSIPERLARYRYYCLAHGLGLTGEHPNIPPADSSAPYPLSGHFEPGMVVCIESYLGDPDRSYGVKLEDEFLIGEHGVERLTTAPFDPTLCAG